MVLRWYAARTRPRAEHLVVDGLERDGLDVFCPYVRAPIAQGYRNIPLFPGYLFLRYDPDAQGLRSFHRVPQLVGLLSFGGTVPPVPDEVIADLAARVEAINNNGGLWHRFRQGDRVQVGLGPVQGLGEVVTEVKSPRSRVRVLLEFLGRQVRAEVPWQSVRPAESHWATEKERAPRRTRGRGRWIRGYGPRAVPGPQDS